MDESGRIHLVTVDDGLRFEARFGSLSLTLDSDPGAVAPNPVQGLLAALAACEGMDVIGILRKKRQLVTAYEVEIQAERAKTHPRRVTRVELVHRLSGHNLSEAAIAEAIRLSEEKYCSVYHSLDPAMPIVSRIEVREA